MKFGKQLKLGTYEPWKDYYIQYSKLKRIINRRKFKKDQAIAKLNSPKIGSGSMIQMSLFHKGQSIDENTPLKHLGNAEKMEKGPSEEKIDDNIDFFPVIVEEMEKINSFFAGKLAELKINLDSITEIRNNTYHSHHTSSFDLKKLRNIYVELAALRSYCDLNRTGFYKIIKKYDKIMEEETLEKWLPIIDQQAFTVSRDPGQLIDVVTGLVSRDKLLEWERFATEQQNKHLDEIFPAVKFHGLMISLIVFVLSLFMPLITPKDVQASRCLSLLLLTVSLWVTEAIPYFATALLIPGLVVFLGVLKDATDPSKSMASDLAATFVLNHVFNHTTMLLLGGYTISSAFARCQLELKAASWLQERFGTKPQLFILAIMFLGLFLSMWISNHTAPILCATIILPIVRDLPTDSRFSKSLLIGLAFACNFGGMMTPISSLQNALAVSYLEQSGVAVSFGRWICVALPFCVFSTVICWLLIVAIMKPTDVISIPCIIHTPTDDDGDNKGHTMGRRNMTVIGLSLAVVILFATSSLNISKNAFGDIGVISLCFVGVMFGSGMLTEVDFNSLSWHTLFLVGGGNVLGKAVQMSGLLEFMANGITRELPLQHSWLALVCILLFCVTVATFVSHTVASIILMPIIARIGLSMAIPEVVVIGSAFAVSAAMALPFSSFPNVNSLLLVDDFQRPYLNVQDFVKTGLPMSLLSVLFIATLGFALINFIMVTTP